MIIYSKIRGLRQRIKIILLLIIFFILTGLEGLFVSDIFGRVIHWSLPETNHVSEKQDTKIDTTFINNLFDAYEQQVIDDYTNSRKTLRLLLQTFNSLPNTIKKQYLTRYIDIAGTEARTGRMAFSDSLLLQAFSLVKQYDDISLLVSYHTATGYHDRLKGKYDSAFFHLEKAHRLATKKNINKRLIPVLLNLGVLELNRNNYPAAIDSFSRGLEIATKFDEKQSVAEFKLMLATIYKNSGKIHTALQMFKSSIQILEEINSVKNYDVALGNLAILYATMGADSLAYKYFIKTKKLAEKQNTPGNHANSLVNLSRLEMNFGNNSAALSFLNEALKIIKKEKIPYLEPTVYQFLGELYLRKNNTEKGKEYISKSLVLSYKYNEINRQAHGAFYLSKIYLENNQIDSAEYYAKRAYKLAMEKDILPMIPKISRILAKINKHHRDLSKSIYFYEKMDSAQTLYQDSLNRNLNRNFGYRFEIQRKEAENKILHKEAKLKELELERKELKMKQKNVVLLISLISIFIILSLLIVLFKQNKDKSHKNQLLQNMNRKITDKSRQLKSENTFKNTIFSIISHDIRSPIISLINIQKLIVLKDNSPEQKKYLENESQRLLNKIMNLIDSLLLWTGQQMKKESLNLTTFDMYDLADDIVSFFEFDSKNLQIQIQNQIPKGFFCRSDYNIVRVVLRNLVGNALKFTPKYGTIQISAFQSEMKNIVSVKDSGIGMDKEIANNLFNREHISSEKGLRKEKGFGLGLYLCKYFLNKCNEEIWCNSKKNEGSTFSFTLTKGKKEEKEIIRQTLTTKSLT